MQEKLCSISKYVGWGDTHSYVFTIENGKIYKQFSCHGYWKSNYQDPEEISFEEFENIIRKKQKDIMADAVKEIEDFEKALNKAKKGGIG